MANRVSFSGEELDLLEIAEHHTSAESSMLEYFATRSPAFRERFALLTEDEVDRRRADALREIDLGSSMSVLAAIEAAVRVDYLSRVYERRRDALSRAMRQVHERKQQRANLEEELLTVWRDHGDVPPRLMTHLTQAFGYRHWIAHGRYWTLKIGRKFDFLTVYAIAEEFFETMDAYGAPA